MENLSKIDKGKFTILLKNPYDTEGNFQFHGLILKDKSDIVFRKDISCNEKNSEGRTNILIKGYIYNKFKESADEQLSRYISANINNMDIYKQTNLYKDMLNWDEDNSEFLKYSQNFKIDFSDINKGTVSCHINYTYCVFDFLKDEFTEIKNGSSDKEMVVLYGGRLNQIMVTEQYKKGIASKAATEIMNLNKFLKGKKSVKLVLADGSSIQIKPGYPLNASSIFCLRNNEYFVDDTYYTYPRLRDITPIENLYLIKFGRQEYRINAENMKI